MNPCRIAHALILATALAACAIRVETPAAVPSPSPLPARTIAFTHTPPAPSPSPLPPTSTPTPAGPRLCSPLQDLPIDQLPGIVSNPFHPPAPGSDDPHQAVDLAVLLPGSQVAVQGHPVQAALAGTVAAVVLDRFPYGNAVLIETPLNSLPEAWWASAGLPTLAPTLAPSSALTCPAGFDLLPTEGAGRSLYLLYAHLQDAPAWAAGDSVNCGQVIGAVGSTGNAMNPHLHFEARVGPSGMRLGSLAHYDSSASLEEMSHYCQWRISGMFQLVDPFQILGLQP